MGHIQPQVIFPATQTCWKHVQYRSRSPAGVRGGVVSGTTKEGGAQKLQGDIHAQGMGQCLSHPTPALPQSGCIYVGAAKPNRDIVWPPQADKG